MPSEERDEPESEDLRRAYEARGRLLASQRWALADRVSQLDREIEALREQVRWLEGQVAERTRELEELRSTRTFRYTAAIRGAYGRLRGLFGR